MGENPPTPPPPPPPPPPPSPPHLIFTYGTLKRDFPNYHLIQDIAASGHDVVSHLGTYITQERYPLVIGPHGIPFLINLPGEGHRVKGDLYSLSDGLALVDHLEGTTQGHYQRLPIKLQKFQEGNRFLLQAHAYFADPSFGESLWDKCGRVGLCEYGPDQAQDYVKPNDRPIGGSFLADVTSFIS